MEKQQERRDGGRSSRNSGRTGPEPDQHCIEIVEVSPRVKNWIEYVINTKDDQTIRAQPGWPSMPKVPEEMLRRKQDSEKFYEPKVISIGPYHNEKPHLRAGESIKPLCAQKFIADSNQNIGDLYQKIASNIKAVRKCYDTNSTARYDDEKLAWMMLLDGCFILQFIRSSSSSDYNNLNNLLRNQRISSAELDLLLLENQLPFRVLRLIFEGAQFKDGSAGSTMKDMINRFIAEKNGILLAAAAADDGGGEFPPQLQLSEEPSHLLHLMRSALLGGKDKNVPAKIPKRQGTPQPFRRIMELRSAGIFLRPSRGFLTDISCQSYFCYGILKLPQITIDDSTYTRFMNILAYEMCSECPDDNAVTSYICFLDSLIDHADDVKELRSNRILYNRLGSDEDVAKIFNDIATGLVDSDIYEGVRISIQEHYDKLVNTYVAQWIYYFSGSPMRFMGFLLTVASLYLAAIQTYFTMFPPKGR